MTENSARGSYQAEIEAWRQTLDDALRRADGWLSVAGLDWLREGANTVGSATDCDIVLPSAEVPLEVGVIHFQHGVARFVRLCAETVLVDGTPSEDAMLLDDHAEKGATIVAIGAISFFVIKRGDQYGVRIRDRNHPARLSFAGRQWFAVDSDYRVEAQFYPHPTPRTLPIVNSAGITIQMNNPGIVEFMVNGQSARLEAFDGDIDKELWFIFKDQTNGTLTYGAGRFLYAPLSAEGIVDLDFNRAYSPPCAFTAFATCPLPPKENRLVMPIEAGEKVPGSTG